MKTILILALLAVAATLATANVQLDPIFQEQNQYPEQQLSSWQQQPFPQLLQQQLNPCRQFLVQQCSPVAVVPFLRSQILQQSSCQVMRQQCCRQLAQIPEQLRCPAIHSIVHAIIMQQQQQQWLLQPQAQQQWFLQPHAQRQWFLQPQAQQQWSLQPQAQQQWFLQPWAQQQQQQQQWFFNPRAQQQQWFFQPQAQQVSQGIYQPQQQGQIEGLRAFALQALPAMCDVYVPPHCSVSITPTSSI